MLPRIPLTERPRQKSLKCKEVALLKKKERRTKGKEQGIGNRRQIKEIKLRRLQTRGLWPASTKNVKKSGEQKTKEGTKTERENREPKERTHKVENRNLDSKINKWWQTVINTTANTKH